MTDFVTRTEVANLRKTGISIVGDAPWGTHFCQFYQNGQDILDILVPYFKAGLENNEFCMWVTSEPLAAQEARDAMARAMPHFDRYFARGQIEILPHTEWYLKGGSFEMNRVLNGWMEKLDMALSAGYDGLRLTGNTFWLEKRTWRSFTEYEAAVNNVISKYHMMALCTYCLNRCSASEVIDVVRNHQFALIKQEGKWQIIESTPGKGMREALRQSEERYRSLFDNMTEAFALTEVILDDSGKPCDHRILEVNSAWEKLFGLTREKTVGKTFLELEPEGEPDWIENFSKVALTGESMHFERFSRYADRWLEVYAYSTGKGCTAHTLRDVTDRKKAEEEIRNLSKFPAENPNPVLRVTREGTIIFANQTSAPLLDYWGIRAGQPLPPNCINLISEVLASGLSKTIEVDCGGRVFALTFAPIADGGYINIYGFDVTQRMQAEEACQLRTQELTRSNAELEQFAYVASHDLQEPLRMVSSYVQLLANRYKDSLDQDANEFIAYACDGALRMQKLINDLLAYSRVETRGREFQEVSLESALARALDNLKLAVEENHAVVTHDPLPTIRADSSQITQVFQNLIDNAIKFHGREAPRIHVSAVLRDNSHVCYVSDNGIGIAPEFLNRIFVIFQRLHTRNKYPGTGIGLAICKRIVERHGGRIWAESRPGEGSTFYFTIPVRIS